MNSHKLKPKRIRRTKEALENEIWSALEREIVKKGFNNITLTGLAQEAKIEPPVIYNRFSDIDDLLEKYVRKYDYWLSDLVKFNKDEHPKENYKRLLTNLIKELYDNKIMQRVLLWEIEDTHEITRRIAFKREFDAEPLVRYHYEQLGYTGFNFNVASSLLISGVYYLILRKQVSTFGLVDFDTEEGKKLMIETAEHMIEKLFSKPENSTLEIAKNLLKNGIDRKIIQDSVGISMAEIEHLELELKAK